MKLWGPKLSLYAMRLLRSEAGTGELSFLVHVVL